MESKNKTISEKPKDVYNTKSVQDNPGKEIFDKIYKEEHPSLHLGDLISAFVTVAVGTAVLNSISKGLRESGTI